MDLSKYSLICFDFDGLLVNTEPLHYEAYKSVIEQKGISFPADYMSYLFLAHHFSGTKLKEYIKSLLPLTEDQWLLLRKEKSKLYSEMLLSKPLDLMPGVSSFLELLNKKSIPHCVVTNSFAPDTEIIRKTSPYLSNIKVWITRETYDRPKPLPDSYLQAIKQFHLTKPSHALAFEDSLKGLEAAQLAGLKAVLICSDDHPQLQESTPNLTHYPDFYELI